MFTSTRRSCLAQAVRGRDRRVPPLSRSPPERSPRRPRERSGIKQAFTGKVGAKYLVSSTGCKNRKWKFSGNLEFATDRVDGAPAPADLTTSAKVSCKKA